MTNATTPSRSGRVPTGAGTGTAGGPSTNTGTASGSAASTGPTYADAASAAAAAATRSQASQAQSPDDDEMVDAAGSSAAAGPAQTGSPHRASFAGSSTPWPGVPPYLLDTPIAVQLHPSEVASRAIQQGATTDSALERGKMRVSSAVAAASAPGAGSGEGQLVPSVPLPTAWNSKDKCSLLQLSNGSLTVTYNGTGKNDGDAAAVRSNHPMHPACGVYYFEIDIISKGRDGYIGIGFSHAGVSTNRLPGWEPGSWGYHGDDGHSFACYGTGKPYGPTFTTGDVIGCGVNFAEGNWSAFFTKNGQSLGIAFKDLKVDAPPGSRGSSAAAAVQAQMLYPSVGLRTPGEVVEANFGQRPFRFDIEGYFKETKQRIWSTIQKIPLPLPASSSSSASAPQPSQPTPPAPQRQTTDISIQSDMADPSTPTDTQPTAAVAAASADNTNKSAVSSTRSALNDLVLSYLIHQGYTETAEAFARGAGAIAQQQGSSAPEAALADVEMDAAEEGSPFGIEGSEAASMAHRGGLRNEAWVAASLMNKEIKNRQKIRDHIMEGSIDRAIEMLNKLHPAVLDHPVPLPMLSKSLSGRPGTPPVSGNAGAELAVPPVSFYLKVRRFIDLVGLMASKSSAAGGSAATSEPQTPRAKAGMATTTTTTATPRTTRSRARAPSVEAADDEDPMILATPARATASASGSAAAARTSDDSDEHMDDSEDAMDVDGSQSSSSQRQRSRGGGGGGVASTPRTGGMAGTARPGRNQEQGSMMTPTRRTRSRGGMGGEEEGDLLMQVMALGQELKNEFGMDEREPFQTTLQECFSLLAYADPYKSPLAYLLEPSAREPVANMVNSVILAVQGKPPLSALEVVYRQTASTLDELVRLGVSAASFVNLRKDCLL